MKNIDDLIENAAQLTENGLSKGEIADELNVSRRTASWLVSRSATDEQPTPESTGADDVHVDWSTIGQHNTRLSQVSAAMANVLATEAADATVTVGIEKAGVPLGTAVAQQLETSLAAYAPAKHQWDDDEAETSGSFSRNFTAVEGERCFVVDDTITSGTTMRETIEAVREAGGTPVAGVVLVDKEGVGEIADVPIHSLVEVIPVADR
ncbi:MULTISPECIES: transcriptional regulator GfcR [unclassified Haladaptatus]|uniref:transcriptional regulator GfcR n=1 Tax=unclassified Haladaptatus TaxID=2622732 RepID=UPI0023E848A6|nr:MULTISPECIES: transcriptional regulator GfcR [unclassified Haladaptatus]